MPRNERKMTIRLEPAEGQRRLVFRVSGREEIRGDPFPEAYLETGRKNFVKLLDAICKSADSMVHMQNFKSLDTAVRECGRFTAMYLREVLGEKYFMLSNVLREFIEEGIHDLLSWERPLGIIEYESSLEKYIPLDYLYINLRESKSRSLSLSGLIPYLCQILGFAFIVQRNTGSRTPNKVIGSSGKLDIDIYAHAHLGTVEKEIKFFRQDNRNYFDAEVEYPGAYGKDPAKRLVARLINGRDAHFHHYCCHCCAEGDDSWEHWLEFGKDQAKVKLTMADLHSAFDDAAHDKGARLKLSNTFSFLNACGGGVLIASSRFSFPYLFVKSFGHLGFIGPEYDISEAFASEFARVFYANLLRLGHIGMALFRTRWFFAKKHKNPLGLLYTLYADPDLQLSKRIDSVNLYAVPEELEPVSTADDFVPA